MLSRVQKWGNSQGLRFPKALLREARIDVGDEVDVSVRGGRIVIQPISKVRGRYKLRDLLSRIPADSAAQEIDWGPPTGNEVW
ncbi:MAG: transcriptional regulator/antitoxin, MazE [Planctomycetota bacterium]|nr:MAG: transcriptional regulator/antitoxin, MazE [Planctomycetota bacterium]